MRVCFLIPTFIFWLFLPFLYISPYIGDNVSFKCGGGDLGYVLICFLSEKMLILCWLHYVGQNHFYVMLLLSQGCCFIQSLLFSYVLREDSVKFSTIYFGSLAAVWTLISQQHPSGRRELFVWTPISV
jgi:hypothetical protein